MWLTFLNHLKGKIIKNFMNYNKLISLLEDSNNKIIPIIKNKDDVDKLSYDPPLIEFVLREYDSKSKILEVKSGKLAAGTILSIEDAEFCINNDINIMFSPHFDINLLKYCMDNDSILIPGVFTPSEIMEAYNNGVKIVKYFPAKDNINSLKQYSDVFSKLNIKFIPTGGISVDNINDFLSIDNVIAVGSSSIK